MIVARPLVTYVLSNAYEDTWRYIPFLLVSVAFSSLSGFLSSKLIASEQTKPIFKTTIIGAVVNTILNFVLIPVIGINGAGLATLIGFAVVLFVREKLLKKQNELEISFKRSVIFGVIVIQIIVYYAFPLWESVAIMLMLFLVLLFILRESVFGFVKNIASKVLKK